MNYGTWLEFKQEPDLEKEMHMLVAIARRLRDKCTYIKQRLGMSTTRIEAGKLAS